MTKEKSNFWKIFWPSLTANFLGSIVGIAILFIFIIALIAGLSSSDDDLNNVKEDTVLHLTLEGGVKEKTNFDFDPLNMSLSGQTGLSDLLYGFEKAKTDDRIKGIFIEIKNTNFGYSTARTIRNAINEFEKSGKFVIAYNSGEYISQKAFYITSAVNDNYAFPTSMMQFTGLGAELSFYKNTLDKLNVEVEVIRGTNNDFKSAVEPYFRTNMSDSSRHQIETYMNGMWNEICSEIAKDTKQNTKELNLIADSLLIRSTGRCDFQGGTASTLYHSIHKLFTLPDSTQVYPGHDYNGFTVSTIGEEKEFNSLIRLEFDKATFVNKVDNLNLEPPKKIKTAVPANHSCGLIKN